MSGSPLRESQLQMARYLRDPESQPAPQGIEERRLKIYRDLIYNNIEGFISGGFPVLRSLYGEDDWHGLVRLFIHQHHCHTPYFLEISQEFLRFLMEDHRPRPCDPPFMLELAHYEWVELALDVSEEALAPPQETSDLLSCKPGLSALAWVLSYQYPVHRIGASFQPREVGEPSFLVVYRDREDKVRFVELNAATARLLELVRDSDALSAGEILGQLAGEMSLDATSVQAFGTAQLADLVEKSVVTLSAPDTTVAPVDSGE